MIKKTTLHPQEDGTIDLYPKTSTDQVEGLQDSIQNLEKGVQEAKQDANTAYNVATSAHSLAEDALGRANGAVNLINERVGEKVSINAPKGASQGVVTTTQLATLQKNNANYIEMVNDKELYYLNDNGHTDGYLTYSHVGIENSKATIKTLTITVSAKSFVIVTTVVPTGSGGGKLYRHMIVIAGAGEDSSEIEGYFKILYYSSSADKMTDLRTLCLLYSDYDLCIFSSFLKDSSNKCYIGTELSYIGDNNPESPIAIMSGYSTYPLSYTIPDLTIYIFSATITDTVTEI